MSLPGVLFVDDEEDNLKVFKSFFKRDYNVFTASSAQEGNEILKTEEIAIVLADQRMPMITGVEFLKRVKEFFPDKIRMIVTGHSDMEAIVRAINEGEIYQYISKPWDNMGLKVVIDKALDRYNLQRENKNLIEDLQAKNEELLRANKEIEALRARAEGENEYLRKEIVEHHNLSDPIGSSSNYKVVLEKAKKVASTDSNVLVLGETGTGKELIARLVHQFSKRAGSALVKINCAALPATIIESELFGHEKGAFSGAVNKKIGLFEVANNGTVFLDEVGEMPIELQPKLLRFLQDGEFRRVGGTVSQTSNARIVAATNKDLRIAVQDGEFREDLYYRLNVFPIKIPPLRERKDDIESLVNYFMSKFEKTMGVVGPMSLPAETLKILTAYHWPGNVRELENVVERSMILSDSGKLHVENLARTGDVQVSAIAEPSTSLEEVEKRHIAKVLVMTGGKISGKGGASEVLNLNPSTLRSRIKKLGIELR